MIRSRSIRIVAACLAALVGAPSAYAPPAAANEVVALAIPTFQITGTGWGHGIGLSQYGAQGAAIAGKDYRWILAHYYTGTTVGAQASKDVRVNLDPNANYRSGGNAGFTRSSWRILPGQPGASLAINGVDLPAGTYTFTGSGTSIAVAGPSGFAQTYSGTVTVAPRGGTPSLLQVVEGTGIYGFANTRYRGSFALTASNGLIKLLNVIAMDPYLYGVVPREMPSGWRTEALRAQAVAARSYSHGTTGELYCTTMSHAYQGYGGYNSSGVLVGEAASTNAAVDATRDQVVKSGSTTVRAFYFSQSGGHTANNEDVWVTGTPLSYMRGVPDSYEHLANPTLSPWPSPISMTGLQMADKLRGLSGVPSSGSVYVTGITPERVASGHVRHVSFRFSNGATARISGDSVRSKLGLRSTHFYFSGFPMQRISGPTRYDTAVQISKRAFPSPVAAVVVASGENYPDALAGSGLAGVKDGSLLLTARTWLPDAVRIELQRLAPSTVYLMGSAAAIDQGVEHAIRSALPGAVIERVEGPDRYATAEAAARKIAEAGVPRKVIVVSGTAWPDAASASALAYARAYPVLLVKPTGLSKPAADYLAAYPPDEAILVGGANVLSEAVRSEIVAATGTSTRRLAGLDRYETAAAVARYCISTEELFTYNDVYIATGVNYPDALTGGVLAGVLEKPLLLTHTDFCKPGTAAFLTERKTAIGQLWIFGGPPAVSEKGLKSIDAVMMQ